MENKVVLVVDIFDDKDCVKAKITVREMHENAPRLIYDHTMYSDLRGMEIIAYQYKNKPTVYHYMVADKYVPMMGHEIKQVAKAIDKIDKAFAKVQSNEGWIENIAWVILQYAKALKIDTITMFREAMSRYRCYTLGESISVINQEIEKALVKA